MPAEPFENGALERLVRQLSTLPGLGRRSARRIALHLLVKKEDALAPLSDALIRAGEAIQTCETCGNLDEGHICRICRDPGRDASLLCVVANVSDLWAIERSRSFRGRYHVLGGVLSALDGVGPSDLRIRELTERLSNNAEPSPVSEIILALSVTVDAQSTAHYLTDLFSGRDVKITRLAHGVPVGGELGFLDDSTIATAIKARGNI